MREQKRLLLDDLSKRATEEAIRRGFDDAGWLRAPLNNARLVSVGLYRGHLGAFRTLMEQCSGDFACFYTAAEELADAAPDERRQRLEAISAGRAASPPPGRY